MKIKKKTEIIMKNALTLYEPLTTTFWHLVKKKSFTFMLESNNFINASYVFEGLLT